MLYGAEELVFRRFGGGLVLDVDPTEIGDDQANDAANVDFEDETLTKRKGRAPYNASAPSGTDRVLGIHRYYPRDGSAGICLAAMRLEDGGCNVYEDGGDGSFSAVLETPLSGETPVDFVAWKERVYTGNGVDPLQRRKADGSWTPVELLDAPAEAPRLSLAQTALEGFNDSPPPTHAKDPTLGWVVGAGLSVAADTTLEREGAGCLKLTANNGNARGSVIHKRWSAATTTTATLMSSITASGTTMTLNSTAGLAQGDYLQIEAEMVKVAGISGNTVTVERAQGGTIAEAHTAPKTVTKCALDLSEAEYVSLWYYSEKLGLVFQVGVKDNSGLLDFSRFPVYSTQQRETWVRIRVPLSSIPPAERTASPGLGIKFVEKPTGVNNWGFALYFDEARAEGPLVPDHYYYYATYAETQEINGREVVVRESNPGAAGEVDVPVDDAALGVVVEVPGVADTANYTHVLIYRRRRDGPFTRARLVKTLENPGAGTVSFTDTVGDDELAIADAPELVAGKINPPIARTYAVSNARLVAGHVYLDGDGDGEADTWYPWRLHLSRLGHPEEFGGSQEPTDTNAPGWLDIANRDHIRRLLEFDGQLIVFCDRAIYTLEGSGWDDFVFRKRADVGLDARNAVISYDRMVFFLAHDGVRALAPNRSQDGLFETWVVSEPVDGLLRSIPAAYRAETAFGLDERGRLHVSFVRSGETTADAALVFDPTAPGALAQNFDSRRRGWTYYTGWGFSCFHTLKRGGGDAGQLLGGDPTSGTIHYLHRDGNDLPLESDSGTPIPWHWQGKARDAGPGSTVEFVYLGGEFDAASGQSVTAAPVLEGRVSPTTYPLPLGNAGTGYVSAVQRCGATIRGRFAALRLSGAHSVRMKCRSARVGYYVR